MTKLKTKAVEKTSKQLKIVIIGDSYTTFPRKKKKRVPYQLRMELGLSEENFIVSCRGGSGFTTTGYRSFKTLLKPLKKDKEVTHVVFVGSLYNDRRTGTRNMLSCCKEINSMIRKRYPNATVMVATPNWHASSISWRWTLERQSVKLQKACDEYGWLYLHGCDKVLHDHPEYFAKDKHHPNEKGTAAIAKKLGKEIIKNKNKKVSVKTGVKNH